MEALPDQRSNPRAALHWQADAHALRHQGSPCLLALGRMRQALQHQDPCFEQEASLPQLLDPPCLVDRAGRDVEAGGPGPPLGSPPHAPLRGLGVPVGSLQSMVTGGLGLPLGGKWGGQSGNTGASGDQLGGQGRQMVLGSRGGALRVDSHKE